MGTTFPETSARVAWRKAVSTIFVGSDSSCDTKMSICDSSFELFSLPVCPMPAIAGARVGFPHQLPF